MSRRGRFLLWCAMLCGLPIVGFLVVLLVARPTEPAAPRPPELGGQRVPARVHEIRFDRKYDLHCSFYREEPTIFRHCEILGFTGRGGESARSGRVSGLTGFASSSGSESYFDHSRDFNHWLVLKLADGRLAYVPPNAVRYIEEASPEGHGQ
ncbi:MAG: hypothetical protein AB7I30_12330 [Isosphaeraceae bacterium]